MLELQKKLHDLARENIERAQQRQKRQFDAKHNSLTKLKVGDQVLVKSMANEGRKGGKLEPQFGLTQSQRIYEKEGSASRTRMASHCRRR